MITELQMRWGGSLAPADPKVARAAAFVLAQMAPPGPTAEDWDRAIAAAPRHGCGMQESRSRAQRARQMRRFGVIDGKRED